MHPCGAHQRPEQGSDQRHVRHQRGDFDTHRLFKRLLNGRIPHGADKAQAHPLQETQQSKLFNILRQQRGKAGDDEPHHARQHHRATANTIRQRA